MTASELIAEARSARTTQFVRSRETLPDYIADLPEIMALMMEMVLSGMDYEAERHSDMALCLRILAIITSELEDHLRVIH